MGGPIDDRLRDASTLKDATPRQVRGCVAQMSQKRRLQAPLRRVFVANHPEKSKSDPNPLVELLAISSFF
jgi:hypothetical protein